MGEARGTLAGVDGDQEAKKRGARLRALREHLGLTHDRVVALSADAAARMNARAGVNRYDKIGRTTLSSMESGRLIAEPDHVRGVLASVYGLTRDELADYLDGVLSLSDAVGAIQARQGRGSLPTYSDHPEWEKLVAEARRDDPELTDETFEEVGRNPFLHAPIESVDARFVAHVARAVQNWRRRSRS